MNKYLITGASGKLGRELTVRLQDDAAARPRESLDVTNYDAVFNQIAALKPEAVIHTACADPNNPDFWRVTVKGTANVTKACISVGIPIVYISSGYVFEGWEGKSYNTVSHAETDPIYPLHAYGQAKAAAEHQLLQMAQTIEARKKNQRYWIIRTGCLFEKPWRYSHDMLSQQLLNFSLAKKPVPVQDKLASFCYVPHAVDAILHLLQNTDIVRSGVYHLANSGGVSLYDFFGTVARTVGKPVNIERIHVGGSMQLNCDNFIKNTGFYALPSWRQAVDDYARFARKHS